jgi:hypothetical protein
MKVLPVPQIGFYFFQNFDIKNLAIFFSQKFSNKDYSNFTLERTNPKKKPNN